MGFQWFVGAHYEVHLVFHVPEADTYQSCLCQFPQLRIQLLLCSLVRFCTRNACMPVPRVLCVPVIVIAITNLDSTEVPSSR
jgi:hypothetical protein